MIAYTYWQVYFYYTWLCSYLQNKKKKSQTISTEDLILLSLTDCFEGEQQYYVSECDSPTGI